MRSPVEQVRAMIQPGKNHQDLAAYAARHEARIMETLGQCKPRRGQACPYPGGWPA